MLTKRVKIILVLGTVGVLGGVAPIVMKIALAEFTPLQIAFTRFFFAALILIPIAAKTGALRFERNKLPSLTFASFLFAGNILLFILGLPYTTTIASQLLYLLVPALVLMLSFVLLKQTIGKHHLLSLVAGGIGGSLIIFPSTGSISSSLGTLQGNMTILLGVCSWASYMVVSKKISSKHNALGVLTLNSCMTALISGSLLAITGTMPFEKYMAASSIALSGLAFLIIVSSILFFFLYQWLINQVKPFTISMTTYLGVLSTALLAIPLLHESVSASLATSALLIFVSSYLALHNK